MIATLKRMFTELDSSKGWKSYLGPYTLLFIVMMAVMSFSFLLAGKGFIWNVDGLSQQYVFFTYEGIWLRELLADVLTGQDLPLWTSQVGWGGDPFLTILSSLGNPQNLISVLVPPKAADVALNFLVPIQLYVAGILFSGFCFYKGKNRFAVLAASMVYLFGGFTTIAFTQIFMLYHLVLAPLVIWGAEKLFARQNPILFMVAMALLFLASITLAYAACLLLVVYCIVRFVFMPGDKSAKLFFTLLGKFVGCITVGALIGAIIALPTALCILSQGRIGLERPDEILYNITYYRDLLLGFIGLADVGADCSYGFAAVGVICVFMLFVQKPAESEDAAETKILRTMFIVMVIFLCLPVAGRVFNGFAYANNRWVWAFVLLVGYITAAKLPVCTALGKKQARALFKYAVIFSLIIVFVLFPFVNRNAFFGMLVMFAVLVLLTGSMGFSRAAKQGGVLLSLVLCAAFLFNTYGSQFVDAGSRWAGNMAGFGRSYKLVVEGDPTTRLQQIEDDEFWRYDVANVDQIVNGNLLQDMNALRFYSSYYNQYIDDFQTGLALRTSSMNFMYTGLDSRAPLESLAGVKYMVSKAGSENLIPETFQVYDENVEVAGKRFDYASSDCNLPLIYVHDSAISRDAYDAMTPTEKQDALLQGAVLDSDAAAAQLAQAQVEFSGISQESTLCYEDGKEIAANDGRADQTGIEFDGNAYKVNVGGTKVLLKTYAMAGDDTYVYVPRYTFENLLPTDRYTEAGWNAAPIFEKERAIFDDVFFGKGVVDSKVFFSLDGVRKELWSPTKSTHLYGGKTGWVVNLGHSDGPSAGGQMDANGLYPVTIELTFQDPGIYTLGDLQVTSQPASQTEQQVQALQEQARQCISNVTTTGSSLSCDASLTDTGLIYLSVPYSSGWSATLDGEPVDIQHANVAFMGVVAGAGDHHLELRYTTPGLAVGAVLTLCGLTIFAVIAIVRCKMKRMREGC